MTAAHTPGPWKAGIKGNWRVYGPDASGAYSGVVAVVSKGRGDVSLICAAPDLLACVQSLLALHTAHHNAIEHAHARKVVARALGETA